MIDLISLYENLNLVVKTENEDFAIHCTIMTLSQVNSSISFVTQDLQKSCSK